jgi:RimJ/RimL family protein N-acetyltransferase
MRQPYSQRVELETERLLLRELTHADVDSLHEVLGDPEAMRFYPRPKTREETRAWIDWGIGLYPEGLGLHGVVLRGTGELVGDCGLTYQDVEGVTEVEIGYHVKRRLWGQGYATEAALAWRDYARDTLGLDRLVAIVAPDNLSSRRVAAKMGMSFERAFVKNDLAMLLFSQRL